MNDEPRKSESLRSYKAIASFLAAPAQVLRSYRRANLSADLVAGVTVAAVAVPQAIAYASIAELPPQTGLYAAAVASIVGALWGSSRFLSTGPTNATSLLVLSLLLPLSAPGSPTYLLGAGLLAVLAGLVRLILASLRFGALVTLASRSVLVGFTAGAGLLIAANQLRHLLRLDTPSTSELFPALEATVTHIGETHLPSLILGLGTLAMMVVIPLVSRRVPAAFLAIAVATLIVWLLGGEDLGILIVGHVPRSLPPPTWVTGEGLPDLTMIRSLVIGATAVAALGLVESSAASQTLARKAGHRLDHNQEFFGQGLANLVTGLLSGYPCSGSLTRSALAYQSGARTQIAGVVTGLVVLLALLLLAPLAGLIPRAALAGVLLYVAYSMVDRSGILRVFRTLPTESVIMVATFGATLTLPLEFAILTGVVLSLAFFIVRSSLPRVYASVPDSSYRHFIHDESAPACPQLGIMTIRGPLFFGAVYHVEEELRHNLEKHPGQSMLLLRMHGVDICDLSGIEMLEATVNTYRNLGGDVYMIRVREPVLEVMRSSGFLQVLGEDHILQQEAAIGHLFERAIDPIICTYECELRVFAECQGVEKHRYEGTIPPTPLHWSRHQENLIDHEEFREIMARRDALVLDVREPDEYAKGHLPGSRLIPLRLLPKHLASLPRDRPILLVTRSGRRAVRAQPMLQDAGISEAYGLRGGILAWKAAALPLEYGPLDPEIHTAAPDEDGE